MAMHEAVGIVSATSSVTGHMQRRAGAFVPGQALAEPYPVPVFWNYLSGGASFEDAATRWAEDTQRWDQEHITRVMRDMARLGQEKTTDWVDA